MSEHKFVVFSDSKTLFDHVDEAIEKANETISSSPKPIPRIYIAEVVGEVVPAAPIFRAL